MSDFDDIDYDQRADEVYQEYLVQKEIDKLEKALSDMFHMYKQTKANLRWLVDHSVAAGSISKAKGAELLGIPLIDYVNENFPENE